MSRGDDGHEYVMEYERTILVAALDILDRIHGLRTPPSRQYVTRDHVGVKVQAMEAATALGRVLLNFGYPATPEIVAEYHKRLGRGFDATAPAALARMTGQAKARA